jgi:hypothetical protein
MLVRDYINCQWVAQDAGSGETEATRLGGRLLAAINPMPMRALQQVQNLPEVHFVPLFEA